jgi:hypothetical protein
MQTFTFTLNGDGLWGAEAGRKVTLSGFTVSYMNADTYDKCNEGDDNAVIGHVTVDHDSTWDVYTDTGFQEAAANYTNIMGLDFTEQGMQNDNQASMEV